MCRLASSMLRRGIKKASFAANEDQASRLHSKRPLLFVYDFCQCDSNFETLGFVRDAGRAPLKNLAAAEFEECYGLPRALSFALRAHRSPAKVNWWQDVY